MDFGLLRQVMADGAESFGSVASTQVISLIDSFDGSVYEVFVSPAPLVTFATGAIGSVASFRGLFVSPRLYLTG